MIIYYQILGLDDKADDGAIRARYLELVKQFTPEKEPRQFMRISRAYEAIRNRHARIKSKVTGLNNYKSWTDALEDLTSGIPVERKLPGLRELVEEEKHE